MKSKNAMKVKKLVFTSFALFAYYRF
jgi:hypothetical protein